MDEEGIVKYYDEFKSFINQLTPWKVARIEAEEKRKSLFGGERKKGAEVASLDQLEI